MYQTLLSIAIMACSCSAWAADFSLQVKGLDKDGSFSQQHVLSENYGFGCTGKNLSPELVWHHAPKDTKSFVLTIYDKDAPTGLGWVNWQVVNIPAHVNRLPMGINAENDKLPQGALQTRTDFGVAGYGGACPPQGEKHRYEITLTALKVDKLPQVTTDSMPALVGFFTKANAIGEAKVVIEDQR